MTKLGPGELFHREITQTKPLEAGLRKMGDAQQLRGAGWQGHRRKAVREEWQKWRWREGGGQAREGAV